MTAEANADDGTFYWMTLSQRSGFQFATEQQVRAAVLRHFRLWCFAERLNTPAKRKRLANAVMADKTWLRSRYGQIIASVGREAVDDVLRGRWA